MATISPTSPVSAAASKVDVCHREGNGSFHLINVSVNALPAHLGHGDALPGDEVPGKPGTRFGADCGVVVLGSCQAIRDFTPTATDGNYTIFAGQAFTVYCNDMAGSPSEYLTVVSATNFSQYTHSFCAAGTDVRTNYARVRLNPATLTVDISDQTFAASTGSLIHSSCTTGTDVVTFMPYGVAMSCDGSDTGVGNIDLTGTPFKVLNTFSVGGSGPSGSTTKSSADQVVALTGGGFCGWNSPDSSLFNPFNDNAGSPLFVLNLAFLP